MPKTRSKGDPLIPYNLELRKTIRKMQHVVNKPPRAMEDSVGVNEIDPPHRQPLAPRGVKFTITSTMIQLLNLKGMFRGATGYDANQHLMNFVAICKSQEIPGTKLKEAFLERFYPESKELQMKDEISAQNQLTEEAMHDTWWRFSQKLKKCPNHGLTERHLKHAFYRSLNYVSKPVADAVCGRSFIRKPFSESMHVMDEMSKNNRAWYTRDAEVGDLGFTFEISPEQYRRKE
ncbi:hypothetical protein KY284_008024 [Solanum tuberosum]|nr:hypothetical protein KY284_008024 [Solanum tuberosum]